METVTFNIGGTVFTTFTSTLQAFPDSRLAKLTQSSSEYNKEKQWYFFDRSSKLFDAILDLYRTRQLHIPSSVCGAALQNDLEFWEIPVSMIADCCYGTACNYNDSVTQMRRLKTTFEEQNLEFTADEMRTSRWKRYRQVIWDFMHNPQSSFSAKIYAVVYFLLVTLTVIVFALSTHPAFRNEIELENSVFEYFNITTIIDMRDWIREQYPNPKIVMFMITEVKPEISLIERLCVLFFGIELLLTFICCPRKTTLLRRACFYIDLLLVMINIITFAIENHTYVLEKPSMFWFYKICKMCVILRLVRLMRLVRHISGLKVMSLAIKANWKELLLLLLAFFIAAVMFAGSMYYVEFYEPNTFMNVPISLWWSIVTMTTVGYGDQTPSSYLGYMLASVCAISGILIVAMPIAIIATAFSEYYSLNKIRTKKTMMSTAENLNTAWKQNLEPAKSMRSNNKVTDGAIDKIFCIEKKNDIIKNT